MTRKHGMARYGAVSALLLGGAVFSIFFLDKPVAEFFVTHRGTWSDVVFNYISNLGESHFYLLPSFAAYWALRTRWKETARRLLNVFLTVSCTGLAVVCVKMLFGRCRPKIFLKEGLDGFLFFQYEAAFLSFPSGHATTAMAAAVALGHLFPRRRWVLYSIGTLIAVSRVIVTSHYLSDVLVGMWFGLTGALICAHFVLGSGTQDGLPETAS